MDDSLRLRLLATGVVTAQQAGAMGVDHHRLARRVRDGELVRVRAGVYVDGARHRTAPPVDRHLLEVRAMASTCGPGYAVSHTSAVPVHGLPVLHHDLGPVELARVGVGKPRTDGRLRVHPPVPPALVMEVDGLSVVRPEVAVLQAAATTGLRAGLVAADADINRRMISSTELRRALAETPLGRGRRLAEQVVHLADGRSESPGESPGEAWTRLLLHQVGLPPMEPQAVLRDATGRFVARVDLLDRAHRLVIEFAGALKYAGGGTGQAALVAEKRREDDIRRLGYRVLRLVWSDLLDPARLLRLVREAQQGRLTAV